MDIDLGSQRLSVSTYLGEAFALLLELEPLPGQSEWMRKVRVYFGSNPKTQLIGYRIRDSSEGLEKIVSALCAQMGLPESSTFGALSDRTLGRTDMIVLIIGLGYLPDYEVNRIKGTLRKLEIPIIYDL
ncbi:hypothetical protein A2716_04055 [candidate division WWE3 bacterium RIFCSPHIGHO2_01_FULL_40_23]|nr:MAG: hypothetical protein A2716_04055 [candidate division WWE3 bacterium RIFCSPHIGHO2_01_FULL_40_23]